MSYKDRYLLFIEYFNEGKYMSAQTTLDELWLRDESDDKDFYGGLIQIAVSLYHLTHDNPKGASKIYSRARGMILKYKDEHHNICLKKLTSELDSLYDSKTLMDMDKQELLDSIPKIEEVSH